MSYHRNGISLKLICCTVLLFAPGLVYAGVTGKIAGVIKDAKTGEALPAVNVQIVGTQMGAASDLDGHYFIISVPPGVYTLKVTMIGYTELEVKEVKVSVDQTTIIDVSLQQEVMDFGQSVTIYAERPIIQKDLTTSVEVVNSEEIRQSTVTETAESVHLQTGVFFDPIPLEGGFSTEGRGEPRYSVRGGGQDEVVWFIDGASLTLHRYQLPSFHGTAQEPNPDRRAKSPDSAHPRR